MILTKNILVKLNKGNLSYFRRICNNKELQIDKEVNVDVSLLSYTSNYIISTKCDNCCSINDITIYSYNRNISNGGFYHCKKCKNIKYKNTCIEKYGIDNFSKTSKFVEKSKNKYIEKYGVDNPMKNDEIKNRMISTTHEITLNKLNKFSDQWNIIERNDNLYRILCKKCNHIFEINDKLLYKRIGLKTIICTECNPINTHISGTEIQLLNFIEDNYNGEIIKNNRKLILNTNTNRFLELDIYLPELKLALEYNGLRYHCTEYKDKNYHKIKSDLCEEKGIQLIHIWEDDWLYKQDIVKSIILNKLVCVSNKMNDTKIEIKEIIDDNLLKEFLNNNHIEGYIKSSINIGLFYDNELISLMTFNKNYHDIFNLLRFCNKLNVYIMDSYDKLFEYFINNFNFKEIITEVDRSYSNGFLYKKIGFVFDGVTKPILNIRKYDTQQYTKEKNYKIYNSGNLKLKYFINS